MQVCCVVAYYLAVLSLHLRSRLRLMFCVLRLCFVRLVCLVCCMRSVRFARFMFFARWHLINYGGI